jgi:hypothetical protein
VRHGGVRLPRVRLRPHRLHGGRLLPQRLRRQRVRDRCRGHERCRQSHRCQRQKPVRAGAVRAVGDPYARLPEGRRVGAVRDLPRLGAGRGDGAVAACVRPPIPRRVHRPVAALSRNMPALPAWRRRGSRRKGLSSPLLAKKKKRRRSQDDTLAAILASSADAN